MEVPRFEFSGKPDGVMVLGDGQEFTFKKLSRRTLKVRAQLAEKFEEFKTVNKQGEREVREWACDVIGLLLGEEAGRLVRGDEETFPTYDLTEIIRRAQDPEYDDPFRKAATVNPEVVVTSSSRA